MNHALYTTAYRLIERSKRVCDQLTIYRVASDLLERNDWTPEERAKIGDMGRAAELRLLEYVASAAMQQGGFRMAHLARAVARRRGRV